MAAGNKRKQSGIVTAAAEIDTDAELDRLAAATVEDLRALWRLQYGSEPPGALSKDLMARVLGYTLQEQAFGGLEPRLRRMLDQDTRSGAEKDRHVKIGCIIVREHEGVVHEVMVVPGGFCWQEKVYSSLSTIAKHITGTSWNGPRFFGLRVKDRCFLTDETDAGPSQSAQPAAADRSTRRVRIGGARRKRRGGEVVAAP